MQIECVKIASGESLQRFESVLNIVKVTKMASSILFGSRAICGGEFLTIIQIQEGR